MLYLYVGTQSVLEHFRRSGVEALYTDARLSTSVREVVEFLKKNVQKKYKTVPSGL